MKLREVEEERRRFGSRHGLGLGLGLECFSNFATSGLALGLALPPCRSLSLGSSAGYLATQKIGLLSSTYTLMMPMQTQRRE